MRSRFLLAVCAWLLGAVAATAGSVFAVDQLGQDLLIQQSKQLSVTMVNSDLALENAEHKTPLPGVSPSATASARPSTTRPASNDPGRLLTSQDGTTVATCQQGRAYLTYVSPYNGFEADHVVIGPARVASVVFRDPSSGAGVVMDVSCRAGRPHAQVSQLQSWDNGPGRYNE